MPTSITGINSSLLSIRGKGFTLIEVIVVLFIIGVMTTVVTLNLQPDHRREAEGEGFRLARALEQAVDAAELGIPLAIVMQPHGYVFRRQAANGEWLSVKDEVLADHAFPESVSAVNALLDGVKVNLSAPEIVWKDGRAVPMQFVLATDGKIIRVTLSAVGRADVES